MKIHEAADVLRHLMAGVDPDTGEVLPEEHLLRDPTVQEALMLALQAMDMRGGAEGMITRSGRLNAGRPWTQADLDTIRQLYESGTSIDEIARLIHRRARGIRLQLNLMAGGGMGRRERVDVPDMIEVESLEAMRPARPRSGPANRNHPWTVEAEGELARRFRAGEDPAQLATAFGRSAWSVEQRLMHMGLLSDEDPSAPIRPWSGEEVAELRRLHGMGLSVTDAALRLNRPETAVRARLAYLGLADAQVEAGAADDAAEAPVTEEAPATDAEPVPGASLTVPVWTREALNTLRDLYEGGMPVQEIAPHMGRSMKSVRLQLNLMAGGSTRLEGRIEVPDVFVPGALPALDPGRVRLLPENAGQSWSPDEEERLAEMYAQGRSIREMSGELGRTPGGIRARLRRCGFDPDQAGRAAPADPAWLPAQTAYLRKLHAEGWSIREIARTLGRTRREVASRVLALGLSPEPPAPVDDDRPWTEEDSARLIHLAGQDMNISDIARDMNRSPAAIRARLFYLGLGGEAPKLFPENLPQRPAVPSAKSPEPAPPPEKVAAAISPSRRWTPEEDAYLRQAWAEGTALDAIARRLNRRDRLVRCRLVFLGVADHSLLGGPDVPPELMHQGLPWYPEEIETLYRLFRQGASVEAMAAELLRSPEVVRSRLEILGLAEEQG